MKVKFKAFAQFSVVALLAAACSTDPDSAGLEYMPDMYRSPAIEPYVDYGEVRGQINVGFSTQRSAMVPPRYSIPYYGTDSATVSIMLPYHRLPGSAFGVTHGLYYHDLSSNADMDYEYKMAAADVNPIKLTSPEVAEKVFASGKALYQVNCNHCHGEKGDGEGPMVKSGAYSGAAVLTGLSIADGQMFYSIYYGKGMMGSHATILNKKEIWTLVHYIKKLQDPKYGSFDANGAAVTTASAATDSTATK